jgi:hypothetical protein
VIICDPSDASACQTAVDQIFAENGGKDPECNGQWSQSRYAILFEPGSHDVDINVGYYTQVIGLGRTPDETKLRNFYSPNGSTNYETGALNNFWRGVENVGLGNTDGPTTWAVS